MRRGFTLIEMLVSTALVMLIMLLFAEIFEQAIGTVRAQRGLIANDEKARAITQTLRADLNRLTYRASVSRGASLENGQGIVESPNGIVSLATGDRPDPRQRGFFAYSENDPLDDSDDVLHITVAVDETLRDPLVSDPGFAPYQGRALDASILGLGNLNQPDFDDGQVNGAGGSRDAEICYFLRGTTLYRSVKLLRDPLPSGSPPFGTQPSVTGTGAPLITTYANFYRDFDYSATNINGQLHFHGLESLDNSLGLTNSPLAVPLFRFGHRTNGQPREFDDSAPPQFFGRFTQQETADTEFLWPGQPATPAVDATLALDTVNQFLSDTGNGFVFDNPDRAGEDILMTGVEAFDIDGWDAGFQEDDFNNNGVWDQGVLPDDANENGIQDKGVWADLGNPIGTGFFTDTWVAAPNKRGNNTWGRQNAAYGPGGPAGNNQFDTWHPANGPLVGVPPYHPLQVDPATAVAWAPNTAPPAFPGTTTVIFPDAAIANASIGYVATNADGIRQTGPRIPEWPREPGALVRDGGVLWQCFDNRIGLEKIRITIRFRDPGTDQSRQVTLIHAFAE